jgi:hypothetical protein
MGYEVCKRDAGVYVRCSPDGGKSFVLIYVDDLLIASKGMSEIERVKGLLKKEFTIHDLGEVKDFLGCQVMRDRDKGLISLSCIPKIDILVDKFGLDLESLGPDTPMTKDFVTTQRPAPLDGSDDIGAGSILPPGNRYCELVGSLLYIANTTRPDISQAVGVLSRYRMSPTTAHWNEAIRVLKYLKSTRELVLVLGGKVTELEGFVDADYGGDQDHRFSTTGFVLTVFGGAVVWGSKKQSAVATSTVEAEFMAASTAVKEANWLRGFLEEIGVTRWLNRFGNTTELNHFQQSQKRRLVFITLLTEYRAKLEENYASADSESVKRLKKSEIFQSIKTAYGVLKHEQWSDDTSYDAWFNRPLSNAHLALISTYYDLVPAFHRIWEEQKNFSLFYQSVRQLAKLEKQKRRSQLAKLTTAHPISTQDSTQEPTAALQLPHIALIFR